MVKSNAIAPGGLDDVEMSLPRTKSTRFADIPETPSAVTSISPSMTAQGTTVEASAKPVRGKKDKSKKSQGAAGPSVPGQPVARQPEVRGFLPRLKSFYSMGKNKAFTSFSQPSIPRFLSVEGDHPPEPPLSNDAKPEEQDLALMLNKRTRKVVVAPSIFEYKTYRDLFWLIMLGAVVGFMIGVGIKTYSLAAPPEYSCRRYPCEEPPRADGTYVTFYDINASRNRKQKLPYECLSQFNKTLNIWTRVNYQIGNATFTPRTDCATKRALYYALIVDGAGNSNGKIEPWALLMVAATPVAVNIVLCLFALIMRSQTYRTVFGLLIASAAAGVALAGYYGSLWAIAWGLMFLVALAVLFFTRYGHEQLEMPLGRITRRLVHLPQLIVLSVLTSVLQSMWFVGWLWCFLKLSGRLGVVADVFLFFSLLWVMQYLKKHVYAVAGSVFAAWYFTLSERRQKRRAVIRWPVLNGLKRTMFNSQGTICAWATLDAMIHFLTILQNSLRVALSPRSQVFAVIIGIIKAIFRSVNPYGLCYAMVYGKGLVLSSAEAYGLIEETNISLVAADNLLNYAGTAAGGISALACVLVSWVLVRFYLPPPPNNDKDTYVASLYLPAFFLGAMVGAPILTVLEGMLAMLYVNFSERPEMLQQRDNDLYTELADLWVIARDEYELEMMADDEFEREEELGNLRDTADTDSEDDVEAALQGKDGKKKKKKKIGRGETLDTHALGTTTAKHVVTLKL